MPQSIYVVYQPLQYGNHGTLVYADAEGHIISMATMGPSVGQDPNLSTFSQGAYAAATNSDSTWGTLMAEIGPPEQFNQTLSDGRNYYQVLMGTTDNPNGSDLVATGDDLSAQWNTICAAEQNIANSNIPYSPLTQNSNSAWASALTAAGIPLPDGIGMGDLHWTPGAMNIVGTEYVTQNPANGSTTTFYADGSVVTTGIHFSDGSIGNSYSFPGYAIGRDELRPDGTRYSFATMSGSDSTIEAYYRPDGSSTVNTYDATTGARATTTSDGAGNWQTTTTYTDGTTAESGNIVNPSNGSTIYYNFAPDAYTQTIDTTIDGNAVNVTYTYDPETQQWVAHVNSINGKAPVDQAAADAALQEVLPGELAQGDEGVVGTDVADVIDANDATLKTFNTAFSNTLSALNFLSALQRGDPLAIEVSGLQLLQGATGDPGLSTPINLLNGISSLGSLADALKNGDTTTAIYTAAQAVGYVSSLLADGSTIAKDVSTWLNGGTTSNGTVVDVGKLAYLGVIYNIKQGNYTAAAAGVIDIAMMEAGAWAVPYLGWALAAFSLVEALMADAPPEVWGNASATWDGSNTVTLGVGVSTLDPPEPTVEYVSNPDGSYTEVEIPAEPAPDPGLDVAVLTYDAMLEALNSIIDNAEQLNPGFPLGIIANRLPNISFRDYTGYQLTDINPLTGEQVHPELYYDRTGRPYNAPPGSELGDWSLGERFVISALTRGAIAPLWEVETAALQTEVGDPMAGLTEEERAARAGLLAVPLTTEDTTQTFRPVALDLNGDGVQTTGTTQTVAFNVDDSGFLKNTAWLDNNDAFLFLDRNLNGQVDGGRELFSNSVVSLSERGLQGMRWVDSNYDGRLDAADPVWSELKVWQDANGNGLAEEGETKSLSQLGITELNYAMGSFTRNGLAYELASPDLEANAQGVRTVIVPEGIIVESSEGQATLFVTQVDDKSYLEANRDGVSCVEDYEDTRIFADYLLANDTLAGLSGRDLKIVGVSDFTHGTGYFNEETNSIYFTPDANYFGEAQFTYTLQASTGQTATATVDVTISNVNDAPTVTVDQHLAPIYGYDQRTRTRYDDGEHIVEVLPGLGDPHFEPYTGYDAKTGTTGLHDTPVDWYDPDGSNVGTLVVTDPDGPNTGFTYEVSVDAQMGQGIVDAQGNFSYENWVGPYTAGTYPDGGGYVGRDSYVETYSTQSDPFIISVADGYGASTTVQINAEHTGAYSPDLGSGGKKPIAIDLGNDGFAFTDVNDSNIFFDINGDGFEHRTAWPSAGDGLLVFDANGNGVVDDGSEISFARYQADAQTDLEGLKAFDSNGDGIFSALDSTWDSFGVWQDSNQNGVTDAGEFRSLNDMGLAAVALTSDGKFSVVDGQTVHGIGQVSMADGSTLNLADVTMEYSSEVLVTNSDGSTSVVTKEPFALSSEITGTIGNDLLVGNYGNTIIRALQGDDVVLSSIGNDVIDGGTGDDQIWGAEGNDLIAGGDGNDVIFGGLGSDIIGGGEGDDALMGEGGNDVILADGGNDFVLAGDGNDVVVGGAGDDQLFGEGGNDALLGGDGNDILAGMGGDDMLDGGAGDDVLNGGAGDDTMEGGLGNDTYEVDSAFDVVLEAADAGIDTVESSITYSLGGNVENLTLTGTAAIDGAGNALDNILTGNSGVNVLDGGTGADTLVGGRGNDTLSGGAGNDRYVFRLGDGADTIVDASGSDTLYMGGTLTSARLEGSRVGDDMVVNVPGTTDSVTLVNWFVQAEGINTIEFGDGSFLDRTGIEGLLNRPPVANPDAITAYEDGGAVNVPTLELLANDTDPNPDDVISVVAVGASAVGAAVALANGNVQYDIGNRFQELAAGQTAEDSFTYTISDRLGATASSTVNVTIVGVNDAPVTTADDATPLQEDVALTAVGNVLANDTDVDQGTILAVRNPGVFAGTYGQLTLAADGTYAYTLDNASLAVQSLAEGQVVTETFSYEATDGLVATPSTLTVTITGTNDVPVTVVDTASVQEDLSITASGNVLSNDSDVDQGTVLSVTDAGVRQGNYGQLTLNTDGSYKYDVANTTIAVQSLGRTAQVSEHFDYSVTDGNVGVAGGLDVYLNGTNDAPILEAPLADQDFTFNKMFSWQIPVGSFADIDQGDVLDYSATLTDGSPLPDWLTFDPVTQTFSGTAPTTAGFIDIRVTATDRVAASGSTIDSLTASDVLRLTISNGNQGVGNGLDAVPSGQSVNFNDGFGTSPGSPGVLSFNNNILQGSSGDDILSAISGNNLLDGAQGADALAGSIGNDLIIGGAGNDTITTGTGADIIAFNRGDGQDVVLASTGADNTLSLGGGIDFQSLSLSRSGNDLVLDTGNIDLILLQDWYSDAANHSIADMQIVLSGDTYDPASADPLLNRQIQRFDFAALAQAFDQAMAADSTLTSWRMADTLLSAHLAASDGAALGGDLAYQYNANGTLAGISVTAAETTLSDANFGVAPQLLHPLGGLQTGTARLA